MKHFDGIFKTFVNGQLVICECLDDLLLVTAAERDRLAALAAVPAAEPKPEGK